MSSHTIKREIDFNFNWKFSEVKDTLKPKVVPVNDSNWRDIRLPHDWSVEHSFDKKWDGATGYLPGGVGMYQKHFVTEHDSSEKSTYILFDGVYNNATFWLNGKQIGENPYGYSPIFFDITELLNPKGEENILTVHVDRTRYVDARWYPGSGIYRNVKLIKLNKLHIPIWGTFIKTPEVTKERATIDLDIKIENQLDDTKVFVLTTKIIDSNGTEVASVANDLSIEPQKTQEFNQNFTVDNPKLWHYNTPNMYKAITIITSAGTEVDRYETPFGIRKLEFKAGEGFFLNGENTLIKGVCLHHDGGLVGAAVPKGVWRRRLQLLKEAGVNGIRPSHNPFSEEFLDLCDEMGFLVQDEIFDEWDYAKDKRLNYHDRHNDYISRGYVEHFQKWWESDLTRSVLRDRNHPSVMQWSIGNEIEWTYLHYRYITGFWNNPEDPQEHTGYWGGKPKFSPKEMKARYDASKKGKYILVETAKKINDKVKLLDPTRTTSANFIIPQVSMVSGFADIVDISGFSYRNPDISWSQEHFPSKQVTITECPGNYSDWKTVIENPGVYSMYMWTGIGYLGEKHGDWPVKGGWSDMLNLAGFKVQGWNYFKSIWVDEPHMSFGTIPLEDSGFKKIGPSAQELPENANAYNWRNTNMHWNYENGKDIVVEVSTNAPEVELFLNGTSLGIREIDKAPDRILRWTVPFKAGKLVAKGVYKGSPIETALETTTKATGFTLKTDKKALEADAYDVAHLVVQLIDEEGRAVKTENKKVSFEILGDAKLLGVDNGEDDNIQDFQANSLQTAKGRALAIIQSKKVSNQITIRAKIEGLKDQSVTIDIR
ncbi:glycoside hydrolase family 2 TIM barrel-domain containing protein [Tenacibaculum agarivorans]|uniref:glycoside hydrolase family 2 TIM barrel-domain containing protein n=1 Tax=Tenacibaculum agarivorans TaxID=1908389 RepID=UPI000AB810F5|nr:glycoside hydrolase family 2 TIM barrel-domain containing protein [Tenacibaculum agarivorans]